MRLMRAEVIQHARTSGWAPALGQHLRVAVRLLPFGAVLLAAAAVRGWGLGTRSLWYDEAYSVFIARQPLLEIPRLLQAYDTHPPLHYALLHVWTALFGTGEAAVRLPSVIASVGVVALTFLLARRLAGERVGFLAAILIALSPFQITTAQEARMYPFLTLFGLGATYALWLALEEGRRRQWIAYLVLMVLALYTHHFALLLLLAHGVYVLVVHRRRATTRTWMLWMALTVVAYLPWVPRLIEQLTSARAWPPFRAPFDVYALTDLMGMFSFGGGLFWMGTYFYQGSLPLEYRAAILLPFVLLALCGVAGLGERRRRAFVLGYWLLPVLTIAVISLKWNMFYERYFSFVLPPFAILLAAGVFYLVEAVRRPGKVVALVSVLIFLASFNLPALADVYRARTAYEWRGTAQYVTARARADDFILFVPAFARIPFEYYFEGRQARMILNPKEVYTPRRQVQFEMSFDPNKMAALARGHPRLWIIATIPIGYQARKEFGRAIAPYFREVDEKDFGPLAASLWESRLYRKMPERR